MLPIVVLQLVAGASAAALTLQIQNPLDVIFGEQRGKQAPVKTIYETLTNDGRFTHLTKAINFVGDEIIDVLNDASHPITFFAVSDKALQHGHDHDEDYRHIFDMALTNSDLRLGDVKPALGNSALDFASVVSSIDYAPLDEDDPDKERRKKVIRFFLNAILQYHILPDSLDVESLRENATYSTHLKISAAHGGQHQRVRVSHEFKLHGFKTFINRFSKVEVANVEASNGLIHVINHPIIPPSPIFQKLYQFQQFFSIFTSALQRTGLADDLDLRYVWDESEKHGHFEGTSAVTAFAVPNEVFHRLPKRLQWYLFSPFGTPALKKLLEYHIVPGVIAHSDYFFNKTAETNPFEPTKRCTCNMAMLKNHHRTEPIYRTDATLDTRLQNRTLHWEVEKNKLTFPGHRWPDRYQTIIKVNGHKVKVADVVALNGALHIVDRFLLPRRSGDGHRHVYEADESDDIWQNWEEWLPQLSSSDNNYM